MIAHSFHFGAWGNRQFKPIQWVAGTAADRQAREDSVFFYSYRAVVG